MDREISQPGSLERAYLDREKVNRELRRRQEHLRDQQRQMVRRFVSDHQGRLKELQSRVNDTQRTLDSQSQLARRWRARAWRGVLWSLLALLASGWLFMADQQLRDSQAHHDAALSAARQQTRALQTALGEAREVLADQHWLAASESLQNADWLLASHHYLQAAVNEHDPARAANARLAAREMLAGVTLQQARDLGQPVSEARLLDGQHLLVRGGDSLRLWNLDGITPLGPPLRHPGELLGMAVDYPRALAWTARQARLWDLQRGESLITLDAGATLHGAELLDEDRLLTWDADGDLRWWRADGSLRQRYHHPGAVLGVSLARRHGWLLSWSWDPLQENRSLLVAHPLNGGEVLLRVLVPGRLSGAALSPDGRFLLGWSNDGRLRLWSAATGELLRMLETHQDWIRSGQFLDDRLLTWSDDGSARLWTPSINGPLGRGLPHEAAVLGVLAEPRGPALLTWSADKQARLWDRRDGVAISPPLQHDGPVTGGTFGPEGELLTWGENGSAHLWRVSDGLPLGPALRHPAAVLTAGFDASGGLYSLDRDGGLRRWQQQSRAIAAGGQDSAGEILQPAADPAGKLTLGAALPILPVAIDHAAWMRGARLSDAARRLLVWGGDLFGGQAAVWDLSSGAALTGPLAHRDRVAGGVFHPDGQRFLTWTDDGSLQLWSATGRALGEPLTPRSRILGARWSPDGEQLLSWHSDASLQLWDAQRLLALRPPESVAGGIRRAYFAAPGRLVIEPLVGRPRGLRLASVPELPGALASAWLEVATGTSLSGARDLRVLDSGDWLARSGALPVDPTQLAGVDPLLNNSSSKE